MGINMALPIIFKITDAGKSAALSASQNGAQIKLNLTQVAIGAGKYVPNGSEIALVNEVGTRSSIVSGDVETDSNTLRFSSSITASTLTPVYEIGLMTDGGILFAVAASPNDPFFTIYPDITFVTSFGLSLSEVAASSVTVVTDPNGALSIVIMQQHLAATDPHPQYLNQARFNLFLQTLIPFGYQYDTHTPSNPKPLFDDLLGIDTHWRRITGKIMLATDPNDDAIKDHSIVLGQRGMTTLASNERPHVYPLQTSHKFERYDPSTVIETVWRVSADKVSISEGDAVRFTVTANNLPDGQILDWSIKEGVLDSANNDIASPEKTDNGTVILRNGQAVINFVTTPDDSMVELQKHVRLTVGAPASLSINVPIDDKGFTEKVIHISQSTTEGINLAEYYKAQQGSYPLSTDTVRFIIDDGVDIIAPNTATPAITEGANWTVGANPIVENRGRILGRGGDAGKPATSYNTGWENVAASTVVVDGEPGGDGGTALSGLITVDNYGVIAGGGGGGGGGGFFLSSSYASDHSGGGGGGAPLGLRYANPKSYDDYLENFPVSKKIILPSLANPNGKTYDAYPTISIAGTDRGQSSYYRGHRLSPESGDIIYVAGYEHFKSNAVSNFYVPNYLDYTKKQYRMFSWFSGTWTDYIFTQSTDATIDRNGVGGVAIAEDGSSTRIGAVVAIPDFNINKNKGGDGGGIGLDGQASLLGEFYDMPPVVNESNPTGWKVSKSSLKLLSEPKMGGLAGFIKEGDVTITNYGGGTTKGR